ncbi:D-alanyl-D-alanine carboxypeptidase/D-alanyl-D-alanine-endopeptidase (penicillin-binding protein 4) [Loktanella ponticola]|uniref:D-alanyl-D-alanine carboxypeptidase/D-alanyl-D-alanine-endopeptidase (Penicillin-binding protein 4) n=1 Tax=Yoonia ponticola TaxID=1524255 RepID=A0A7W9BMP3_9RHOB|nr:D-alanyl-D-alanine carboxypeptidase/D-alanyl-D-alanine-endopeptidase [Yoonia ponticola]MBB5723166.1 D-alanyl-D-alanine carboxypeptidase/D-alanyl-D-alanine-endopeptidase (penicillin-binding protein 4) [Yoonia ponticola]
MTHHFTRRALLTSALSSVATVAFAEAPLTSLRPTARPDLDPKTSPLAQVSTADIIAEANLNGVVGFVVADAKTGQMLESTDADIALPPASVTKAVTALFALDTLGGDFKFRTRLLATGPVVDGVLQGDLILAGGGDPNLVTDELSSLVKKFVDTGVTKITGSFQVWGEALPYREEIDPPQMDHLGYNPSVSGLNLNFNRVHFEWRRANGRYTVAMDARSATQRPTVYTSKMRIVDRNLPIFTYAKAGAIDEWTVARGALGEAGSRWLPVRNPAMYAGDVFQTMARALGVPLPNPEKIMDLSEGVEIAVQESDDLTRMMRSMLRYSTNLTAEGAGLTATKKIVGQAYDIPESAACMAQWVAQRADVRAEIADHSGLSDETRISAQDMVGLLRDPNAIATLRPILKNIPIVDEDRDEIAGFPAAVVAKTGTLNFVSSLAGYVRTRDGNDLVFTIFAADLEARARGKAAGDEQPAGSISWNSRAKRLQQRLLQRWALVYAESA